MRHFLAFFVVLSVLALPLLAQDCTCTRAVPLSGTYRIDFNEKINRAASDVVTISVFDSSEHFGASFEMYGRGERAVLGCDGRGGYLGNLTGSGQLIYLLPAEIGSRAGISIGTEFVGRIHRPGIIGSAMNEENSAFVRITLQDPAARASDAMCASAQATRENMQVIRDIHADEELLARALSGGMGGYSASNPYQLNDNEPKELPESGTTYQTIISERVREVMNQRYPASVRGSIVGLEGLDPDRAGASTHPANCRITEPSTVLSDGSCRLHVVYESYMAHEQYHHSSCEGLRHEEGFSSDYRFWINHPENLSLDELGAYGETIVVLDRWLNQNCR